MRRRDFIALLASATTVWPQAVRAQQGYQRLIPLLIDLPGWTGTTPIGTDGERNGGRLITALRTYVRGDARFHALIVSGIPARSGDNDSSDITARGGHESTSMIDGFQVKTSSAPGFVWISVMFSSDARFNLLFNNVADDEAGAISRKFDWRQIQALLPN
jgi:hypothetical protein